MSINVIAEIGINHHGHKNKALRLIEHAYNSGCWGVKFQYRNNDFFATNDEMGSTLIREELESSNLNQNWIPELISYSKKLNLKVGFSFFRIKDLDEFFSNDYELIDFIKIPSPEFRNIELIKKSKQLCKIIMVSYGGGSEEEIIDSINKSNFRTDDVLFHCISNYPISIGNQQLSFLSRLKLLCNSHVGYSSHDEEWEVNLFAASYGIKFIERHICEDKTEKGLDISTSSDPKEFKKLNNLLKNYFNIIRCDKRTPNQGEILNIRNLGTSLYAKHSMSSGKIVSIDDFIEKSPSVGLTVEKFKLLKTKNLCKEIKVGDALLTEHFINKIEKIEKKLIEFSNINKISLPVRLHDFAYFQSIFKFDYYEFHFSYKEVFVLKENGFKSLEPLIDKNKTYSIHLPDYISKDDLIDPFSSEADIKKISLEIINSCISLSKLIKKITSKECLILGSFSVNQFKSKDEFYKNFKNFINQIFNDHQVKIIAQWLPKKAWYFGGTVIVDLFSSSDDIDYCLLNNIPICLDVAHLILSANYFNEEWFLWYKKLLPLCNHIHLSDAIGTDGEGVDFGRGDLSNISEILEVDCIKVLEIWEGHLNNGKGFREGIKFLFSKI